MKSISNMRVIERTSNLVWSRWRTSTECCNSTGSDDNECVVNRADIQIELVKLADGERLLRLADPTSGLALERKLDAAQSVHQQKEQLLDVFESALKRAELSVA